MKRYFLMVERPKIRCSSIPLGDVPILYKGKEVIATHHESGNSTIECGARTLVAFATRARRKRHHAHIEPSWPTTTPPSSLDVGMLAPARGPSVSPAPHQAAAAAFGPARPHNAPRPSANRPSTDGAASLGVCAAGGVAAAASRRVGRVRLRHASPNASARVPRAA
eukprot:scaffold6363_cov25-Tisochrysis_lutea.AAC.12